MKKIEIIPLKNFPHIKQKVNIGDEIVKCIKKNKITIKENDIFVIAHKIISISEGRTVELSDIRVSSKAKTLSKIVEKDPRVIQLIINESKELIKINPKFILTRDKYGVIAANAGVDQSNISGDEKALLLPRNANKSAKEISIKILDEFDINTSIIISDSVGRPWRNGLTQIAIGSYGLPSVVSYNIDLYGNELFDTDVPVIDELSSAGGLLMIKNLGIPVVIIRGYNYSFIKKGIKKLIRSREDDIFSKIT